MEQLLQKALFNKWQYGKVGLNNITNELKKVEKRSEKELSKKELELTQIEKKLATVATQLVNKDLDCEKQYLLNKTNKAVNESTKPPASFS